MRYIRFIGISVLCAGLLIYPLGLHAQTAPEFPPDVVAEIQAALNAEVEENDIPGAVLLIDTPRARFAGASGFADLETQTPLQPDDAFQIGSVTKMFTGVLILQLAEEGLLGLNDPLNVWLPDIAATFPYGDQITLRQLLQHTSGMFDIEDDEELLARYIANPYQPIPLPEMIEQAATHSAVFAPGEGTHYSSTGYLLLGLVIETVTGMPYAEAVRSRILEPTGMTHTYLLDLEPPITELVRGYARNNDVWLDVTDWDRSWAGAAGGGVSTPTDLALFIRALFNGELFTNPDTLDEMLHTETGGEIEYGLGIRRMTSPDDPALGWGHGGRTVGFRAMLIYIPRVDTVFVLMINNGDIGPSLNNMIRPVLRYWGIVRDD